MSALKNNIFEAWNKLKIFPVENQS
jgi:hypothetical protein